MIEKNRLYTVGVIEDLRHSIIGIRVFDTDKVMMYEISRRKAMNMIEFDNIDIVGIIFRKEYTGSGRLTSIFNISKLGYKSNDLDVFDETGQLKHRGLRVILGYTTELTEGVKQYVVVNSTGQLEVINSIENNSEKFVGIRYEKSKLVISTSKCNTEFDAADLKHLGLIT